MGKSLVVIGLAIAGLGLLIVIMVVLRLIKPYQLGIFVLIIVLLLIAFPQYGKRLTSLSSLSALFSDQAGTNQVDSAFTGRATEMLAAARVFADHPWIGVGPGVFKYYSAKYGNDLGLSTLSGTREAHSLYLGIAADLGVPGLICFLAILFLTLHNLVSAHNQWREKQPDLSNIATAFTLSLIAFMTTGLFLHLSYLRYFSLILALANVVTMLNVEEEKSLPVNQAVEHRDWTTGEGLARSSQ